MSTLRMELLSTKCLSEMEMDDSLAFNHKWHMSPLGNNESFDSDEFPSINNITPYDYNRNNNNIHVPEISQKSWKICNNNSSSSSTIISFGNTEPPLVKKKKSSSLSSSFVHHEIFNLEDICTPLEYGEMKRGVVRTAQQAQDHVLAERKRREKLSQKFVALSTLIPGLTKLDKATVLGDAINYIKELKERVKELEAEVKGKHNEEALTFAALRRHRYISSYDHDTSSSDENIDGRCMSGIVDDGSTDHLSAEIEVRASEGNVMVRVYCKNQTGVIREVMSEIEKHNISIISSSAIPFGHNCMHITIIAQVQNLLNNSF
ncbi:hypothetical protein Leryth_011724 [Lithospermum erythrorhizon]|nr:hypothetical protein Leryth_011724 [Lithospermum erythrorhizon]